LLLWGGLGGAAPRRVYAGDDAPPAASAPPTAPAAPPEAAADAMNAGARAHYDRGLALYADKDYAGALTELRAGYALDPRREFLFAQAQALRLGGDCKAAVPLYQQFLTSGPDDVQVNATHIALGRCAAQMAAAPVPPPAADRPRAPPPPTVTTPARTPPPPWYVDVAGGALLGGAVLGLATGAVFTVSALSERDDADQRSANYAEYMQHWNAARSRERVAIVGFAAGAALTTAAVVRYARVRVRRRMDAWISPDARGGALAGVGGQF
jgi:tetratricopeptide (TPR) repeat protein